jgi:hypothetical protein
MNHPIDPPQAATLKELGTEIGKLRYDALMIVLTALSEELHRQSALDATARRPQLSALGGEVSTHIDQALGVLIKMLDLSIPFMADELKNCPLLDVE